MNESDVIDIAREAILVMMNVGGPILILGLIVGVGVSLVQTVTQIQEATLSFVPKLLVVGLALLFLLPFMMTTLATFAEGLFNRIANMGSGA
jgi:flagellar biosynthetic protein FliQ